MKSIEYYKHFFRLPQALASRFSDNFAAMFFVAAQRAFPIPILRPLALLLFHIGNRFRIFRIKILF